MSINFFLKIYILKRGKIPDIKDPYPAHTFYEDRYYPFEKPECAKLLLKITETVNGILGKEMVMDSA